MNASADLIAALLALGPGRAHVPRRGLDRSRVMSGVLPAIAML
ncbi:MAG TPA: hypothetical protein VL225_04975 [Vicinamibacterales bacterium]|jgi:hypothetical protein|nr:hypothetical protein [Vicinamibacterales bacterium]